MSHITESHAKAIIARDALASGETAILAAWDAYATGQGFLPSTQAAYRRRVLHFLRWLAPQGIELAQVTPTVLDCYLDSQSSCDHDRMICRTPLRRLFDMLVTQHIIPSNPARPAQETDGARTGETAAAGELPLPTLAGLKAFLHDLGTMEPSDRFRPGLVAMYPIVVGGMDASAIAAFTGIPLAEVELYAGRLRENGIWTPDEKVLIDFDDPASPDGIVNLVLMIGCAKGEWVRSSASDGEESSRQDQASQQQPESEITGCT